MNHARLVPQIIHTGSRKQSRAGHWLSFYVSVSAIAWVGKPYASVADRHRIASCSDSESGRIAERTVLIQRSYVDARVTIGQSEPNISRCASNASSAASI